MKDKDKNKKRKISKDFLVNLFDLPKETINNPNTEDAIMITTMLIIVYFLSIAFDLLKTNTLIYLFISNLLGVLISYYTDVSSKNYVLENLLIKGIFALFGCLLLIFILIRALNLYFEFIPLYFVLIPIFIMITTIIKMTYPKIIEYKLKLKTKEYKKNIKIINFILGCMLFITCSLFFLLLLIYSFNRIYAIILGILGSMIAFVLFMPNLFFYFYARKHRHLFDVKKVKKEKVKF